MDLCPVFGAPNLLYTLRYMPAPRTQIYLTAEQRKKLDARRKRERKSLAAVVREAIDAYLSPGEADFRKIVEETFGSLPNLEVPSRDEWERSYKRRRD